MKKGPFTALPAWLFCLLSALKKFWFVYLKGEKIVQFGGMGITFTGRALHSAPQRQCGSTQLIFLKKPVFFFLLLLGFLAF